MYQVEGSTITEVLTNVRTIAEEEATAHQRIADTIGGLTLVNDEGGKKSGRGAGRGSIGRKAAVTKAETPASRGSTAWITRQEAASEFGLTWAQIRKLVADGDVKSKKLDNGRVQVRRVDVEKATKELVSA